MRWQIPAKTFLLGEYAAIAGEPAMVLTHSPCFELILNENGTHHSEPIHPKSPAGALISHSKLKEQTIKWHDPFQGRGGMGASSGQFTASYLALCYLNQTKPSLKEMLHLYYEHSWNGTGLKPSGYDVIAQSFHGCVYIDKTAKNPVIFPWSFVDIGFMLVHTGKKLATHQHLQQSTLPQEIPALAKIVQRAKKAFLDNNGQLLINCVNEYHQHLSMLNLVAEHSLTLIDTLKKNKRILAVKGCGALGADVILIIAKKEELFNLKPLCRELRLNIIGTQKNLHMKNGYFQ